MKREYPRIKTAVIDFGPKQGGTYVLLDDGGITGKPFPSESEAWAFDKGILVLNRFLFMPYNDQLALLEQLELAR